MAMEAGSHHVAAAAVMEVPRPHPVEAVVVVVPPPQ